MKKHIVIQPEELHKIEHGIPLPTARGCIRKYPFMELQIGDSFFVPCQDGEDPRITFRRVQGQTYNQQWRLKKRFAIRTMKKGVRIWRTA
jgi:hypothetical protein